MWERKIIPITTKKHRQLNSSIFARTLNLTQSTANISIVFSSFNCMYGRSVDMKFYSDFSGKRCTHIILLINWCGMYVPNNATYGDWPLRGLTFPTRSVIGSFCHIEIKLLFWDPFLLICFFLSFDLIHTKNKILKSLLEIRRKK